MANFASLCVLGSGIFKFFVNSLYLGLFMISVHDSWIFSNYFSVPWAVPVWVLLSRIDLNTFILCLSDVNWTHLPLGILSQHRPALQHPKVWLHSRLTLSAVFCIFLIPHTSEHFLPPLPLLTRLHRTPLKWSTANISLMETITFKIWALFRGGGVTTVCSHPPAPSPHTLSPPHCFLCPSFSRQLLFSETVCLIWPPVIWPFFISIEIAYHFLKLGHFLKAFFSIPKWLLKIASYIWLCQGEFRQGLSGGMHAFFKDP